MPVTIPIFHRPARSIKAAVVAFPVLALLVVAGCGGGGGSGGDGGSATYTIGATVSGLSGTLVLQNNGGSNLTVTADGTYTFAGKYPSGTGYHVTVLTQPAHQGCSVTNATGTLANASVTAPTVTCQDPGLALFAGNAAGAGSADGTGPAASFQTPAGVATDSAGNVYVADFNNETIRKITPGGVVTTLAGAAEVMGSADGAGAAARFSVPSGVATDIAGNVYVADLGNNTIRKITPAGVVSTLAGTAGITGSADGTGAAASFSSPSAVAADGAGNVYVADSGNNTIRKITPAGVVSTLAGTAGVTGSADGTGAAASFSGPSGVAADGAGNVYVGDLANNTIRKITSVGVVTTLAGTPGIKGSADGTGATASFSAPSGVATDSTGNVYVADFDNDTIRKITPAGVVTTLAGTAGVTGSADGAGAAARFYSPAGVATDSANNVYVADEVNNIIRKITPAADVTTLAGQASVEGSADGTGPAALFYYPQGIATDTSGNVYVADTLNDTVRKITPAGAVSTLAGTAGKTGSANGAGAAARFNLPDGVATDSTGNVYVADTGNDTIRKITPDGVVSTLAGAAGVAGSSDGTGAAARFSFPVSVATDGSGNVYVADAGNETIRKITPAGAVTTLAGTAGVTGSADGTGPAASFSVPGGVATDGAGNIYVSDSAANTIRKITPAGVVTTLAGTAGITGSTDGSGAAASFWAPQGLATDSSGILYLADRGNNTIRKITPTGVVSTVAGQPGPGHDYFSPGALPGGLHSPWSVALSGTTLYTQTNNGIVEVTDVP
jgi:sugar lactone lactonase YvrE